jgi:four helix bundle protein
MAKTFEDLNVFRTATELMVEVYQATEAYPRAEAYGLVSQMRRASVSVLSHIAEGQGRLTPGEWRQFLSEARGSLYELEAQLIASQRLGFISNELHVELRTRTREVGGLLAGFIRYVRKREDAVKASRSRNGPPATGN